MNFETGMKIKAANNSKTPEEIFEIVETGLIDADGFSAVKIRFSDGTEEITATFNLEYGIEKHGLTVIK